MQNKNRRPPTLDFSWTPDAIDRIHKSASAELLAAADAIGSLSPEKATFANTTLAFERASGACYEALAIPLFLKYVSPDAAVRDASDRCEIAIQKLAVELGTREDLFLAVSAAAAKKEKLTPAEAKLLDEQLTSFKRNGLALSPADRDKYKAGRQRLVELEAEFARRLVEWDETVAVEDSELEGVPAPFVGSLDKNADGKKLLRLTAPHYQAVMENARSPKLREKYELAFHRRGGDANKALLEEALRMREQLAKLLGFPTHAAYVLDRRMARTPEAAMQFLQKVRAKLLPGGHKDLAMLLEEKRRDVPDAKELKSYDWRYYETRAKENRYSVDAEKVKEYFPLPTVVSGMLRVYEKLFGIRIEKDTKAAVWHPSVERFTVQRDGVEVAVFYFDLFPRTGKYGHAAAFPLLSGHLKEDGSYQTPASSVVANFSPSMDGRPSLLDHGEVETLFHEFGHIMHQVLTTARFASLSGTAVKTDFVEAPSQMLENWVWSAEILDELSGHWQRPKEKLPEEMRKKLIASKLHNSGLRYLRQVGFALIDLEYHTKPPVDSTAVYRQHSKETMLVPIAEGAMPQASFGHLMGGYDAGYYSYLWSEVFAQDLFTRFEKEGLLSQKTGQDYVHWILEPGGEKEPETLLEGFLGRAPSEEAFLKGLGL